MSFSTVKAGVKKTVRFAFYAYFLLVLLDRPIFTSMLTWADRHSLREMGLIHADQNAIEENNWDIYKLEGRVDNIDTDFREELQSLREQVAKALKVKDDALQAQDEVLQATLRSNEAWKQATTQLKSQLAEANKTMERLERLSAADRERALRSYISGVTK